MRAKRQLFLSRDGLLCDGAELRSVDFRTERVAWFLAALVAASQHGRPLSAEAFVVALDASGSMAIPDRKAMSRIVKAAQAALNAVSIGDVMSVTHPPRGATTGPWALHQPRTICWSIDPALGKAVAGTNKALKQTADENGSGARRSAASRPAAPAITEGVDAATLRETISVLVQAEHRFVVGDLATAAHQVRDLLSKRTLFTTEGRAAALIHQGRSLRRMGAFAEGLQSLDAAYRLARQPTCAYAALADTALLMRSRLKYDQFPDRATEQLWPLLQTYRRKGLAGHSRARSHGHSEFDLSNLLALMARRRALAAVASGPEAAANACTEMWFHARESLFLAWAGNNVIALQYACMNTAYGLHMLIGAHKTWCAETIGVNEDEVIAWYALGFQISKVFSLHEDSAWDRIFLGQFWMSRPFTEWLKPNPALQEGGWDPTKLAFYKKTVEHANAVGDARQRAISLYGVYLFAAKTGVRNEAAKAREKLDALLRLQPGLREQMKADGYRPE